MKLKDMMDWEKQEMYACRKRHTLKGKIVCHRCMYYEACYPKKIQVK